MKFNYKSLKEVKAEGPYDLLITINDDVLKVFVNTLDEVYDAVRFAEDLDIECQQYAIFVDRYLMLDYTRVDNKIVDIELDLDSRM